MTTLEVILALIVILLAVRVWYLHHCAWEAVELLHGYDDTCKSLTRRLKQANEVNQDLLALLDEQKKDTNP